MAAYDLSIYSESFPDLNYDIILFFSEFINLENGSVRGKTILEFHSSFDGKYNHIEPKSILIFCDLLCEHNKLTLIRRAGLGNFHSEYKSVIKNKDEYFSNKSSICSHLNRIIYGFKYIYKEYKKYVLPIENIDKEENSKREIGTCFLYKGGIITAKHCLLESAKICIDGISKDLLKNARFKISANQNIDLLFIEFTEEIKDTIIHSKDIGILDDVMTLGFPKIAGFQNFLIAEEASIASKRYTVSKGHIVAKEIDLFVKDNVFLITAKIAGGNSGGPLVANDGAIVGINIREPFGKGEYDELGYGTAYSVNLINELINNSDSQSYDLINSSRFTFINNNET